MRRFATFSEAIKVSKEMLVTYGRDVDSGHWQGVSTEGKPDLVTLELMNHSFYVPMPTEGAYDDLVHELQYQIAPCLPWADLEFNDRLRGEPTNPHASLEHWPWWRGQSTETMRDGLFSHTYSERFWPKRAAERRLAHPAPAREMKLPAHGTNPLMGIRYDYGDFKDLVNLLRREPQTRQAYLPIFFPEDTGAVHGGRIPCTLGYQFLLRNDRLHMWYFIRSCDFIRHFRDDLYLAARLAPHIIHLIDEPEWSEVLPGNFHFVCASLHVHKGDAHLL